LYALCEKGVSARSTSEHDEVRDERERLQQLIADLSLLQQESERHQLAIDRLRLECDIVRRLFDSVHAVRL
jgi:hypothetical protein